MAVSYSKSDLKEVFAGLNYIYLYDDTLDLTSASTLDLTAPMFDLPVTVDTFSFSQAEPTINGIKVHGLNANWTSTSEAGDITISATVPSVSSTLNDYFFGASGTAIGSASSGETGPDGSTKWYGYAYELTTHKITCSLALVDQSGEHLCVISGISLYATPNFENGSTDPFAWTLTGTIEASDTSSNNIAFFQVATA